MMSQIRVAALFDMRAPAFGTPTPELYRAALEMAGFADEIGVARINLMEHHQSEDGYLVIGHARPLSSGAAPSAARPRVITGPLRGPIRAAPAPCSISVAYRRQTHTALDIIVP
jgi:hypothetical protein